MSNKKRVLMVCESLAGGVLTYLSQLCNDMVEDFDIYLLYSLRSQSPENYKDLFDKRVHFIRANYLNLRGFSNLKNIYLSIRELRKIEMKIQPDLIHLHSSIAGGIGRIAYNKFSNKLIYTPHGYAHILMGNGKKSNIYKTLEKILGNKAITLTCCESEDEEAKKFSSKTHYIETGLNIEHLDNNLENIKVKKNEKFTVYTLGRAVKQKQPMIFNEIAKMTPEADFVWIGDGELSYQLDADNIKITGWKNRIEALSIAKSSDVFILCSFGEAIAMSLIENMYMKKLSLVSNTIGNKSVINSGINGYICEKPEDYANCIKKAMVDFPYKLTEKSYSDVLNIYNSKVMKEKYIKFYNDVIKQKG